MRASLAEPPEIQAERLPAYAPAVNPDELAWAWTRCGRLGNLAAATSDWLRDYPITEFTYLRQYPELLATFLEGAGPQPGQ